MSLQVGETVGEYVVVGHLGRGGMGSVYRVRNLISDREEALKILISDVASNNHLTERFYREIKVQASLSHPNIAALHTAFRHQNQLLMVMELVEGETLEGKLRRRSLAINEAVTWAMQLLSALDYAHRLGVVHRDIKPANIMISKIGAVKLLDFGIAVRDSGEIRLTAAGAALGTLLYMSPEQIQATDAVDGRSDLYSTGIVLYECLTGKSPFEADTAYRCMQAHLTVTPPAPHVVSAAIPAALSQAVMRALEKEPGGRFQTAYDFGAALAPFLRYVPAADQPQQPQATQPPPAAPKPPSPTPVPPAATPAPEGWDPAVLEKVRQDLAHFIGPMARVLVKRALPKASHTSKLYELLAEEIRDPAERAKFLQLGKSAPK